MWELAKLSQKRLGESCFLVLLETPWQASRRKAPTVSSASQRGAVCWAAELQKHCRGAASSATGEKRKQLKHLCTEERRKPEETRRKERRVWGGEERLKELGFHRVTGDESRKWNGEKEKMLLAAANKEERTEICAVPEMRAP